MRLSAKQKQGKSKMSDKMNSSLKNISPYRKVMSLIILLCVSSAAHSATAKEKYSHIDCSGNVSGKINKLKFYENNDKFQSSYRLDYLNKRIFIYTVKNEYIDLCHKVSDCIISVSEEFVTSDIKNATYGYAEYIRINRLSGRYEQKTTWSTEGKVDFDFEYTGECQIGISKLQTKPKF